MQAPTHTRAATDDRRTVQTELSQIFMIACSQKQIRPARRSAVATASQWLTGLARNEYKTVQTIET
jgi:hypothetical protein